MICANHDSKGLLLRAAFRWLLTFYLLVLLASHAVRLWPSRQSPPPDGLATLRVAPRQGATALEAEPRITLAYRQWQPEGGGEDLPTVLLLHGSPGSSRDFRTLGPALGANFYVVAPDLPGFGHSDRQVPDYSIRAHAAYALELMDRLDLESVHLLGFSMGGGVALELIDQAPERSRSLTLLSAIGVQELELMGDYGLNHAVHGFQLAGLWLLREAVPHFGALDDALFGVPYARNFYDTDQRPLRGILGSLALPTLILHGKHDLLVPVAAAREHHRLIPQSELILFAASHFMIFRGGERLAAPIVDFIERVERGAAVRHESADPDRVRAAHQPFDPGVIPRATGMALLVLASLIAIATLLTEDFACIGAGLLVAQGRIGFLAATMACFVGIVVGDVLLYWVGRCLGRPWLHRAPLRWVLSPRQVERSSEWFQRRGPIVVFFSRFLPGTRVATYFTAGLLNTRFWRFLLYFILAVAIWTPFLVGIASLFGTRALDYFGTFERWALPSIIALLVSIWLFARVLPLLFTWRGRRRLRGWWCRWRYWEFWPPWFFYPPVILWIGRLAIKYRSLTLFTAANPGIPAGGFVGESKTRILEGLAPEWVAPFQHIDGSGELDSKLAQVRRFVEVRGLELPVVLKPDAGQRGTGVKIARSWDEVERYCEVATMDFLVQEFIAGLEFGVFYVRLPEEETGTIISITDKRVPTLKGDGHSTIEELILADSRAVCLANRYLEQLGPRSDEIPRAGEPVVLADLGTHCRGAIFADGGNLLTAELAQAIDTISQTFDGFFFGRYDVRVPSLRSFIGGKNLSVIELNGVTSEATHIYDRRNSLVDAYKTLFDQWELAFEVGRQNRALGTAPTSVSVLIRDVLGYRRSRRAARREDV